MAKQADSDFVDDAQPLSVQDIDRCDVLAGWRWVPDVQPDHNLQRGTA